MVRFLGLVSWAYALQYRTLRLAAPWLNNRGNGCQYACFIASRPRVYCKACMVDSMIEAIWRGPRFLWIAAQADGIALQLLVREHGAAPLWRSMAVAIRLE